MFISPRGETVVARSATQREGCSRVPLQSLYPTKHTALCFEGCSLIPARTPTQDSRLKTQDSRLKTQDSPNKPNQNFPDPSL